MVSYFEDGMSWGLCILAADFIAWRFLRIDGERGRIAIRALLFSALSYVLWNTGMNPLHSAPWGDQVLRHALAQGLELLWWLQCAQVTSAVLGRAILPAKWHREHLFQDVLRALIFLAAAVASIGFVLELPVRGLLATSGALAIVLGLAIQSTLSDVFSGVVLNATQPFRVGDWVVIGDIEGEVVQSSWRATSLLNDQGNVVIIPNSLAARGSIVNLSQPPHIHGETVRVLISSEARPESVMAAMQDALAGSQNILLKPPARIGIKGMQRRSIQYEALFFVDSIPKKIATQNELFDLIYRQLRARGISMGHSSSGDSLEQARSATRVLGEVDMFRVLENTQLLHLEAALVRHTFSPGDIIYDSENVSEDGHALHIVETGVVSFLVPQGDKYVEVRRLSAGEAAGRSEILAGIKADIKLRAITASSILRLDKQSLTPVLQEHPRVATLMLEALLKHQETESIRQSELSVQKPGHTSVFRRLVVGMRRLHKITR